MLPSTATVGVHWAEFFPSAKLLSLVRNCNYSVTLVNSKWVKNLRIIIAELQNKPETPGF